MSGSWKAQNARFQENRRHEKDRNRPCFARYHADYLHRHLRAEAGLKAASVTSTQDVTKLTVDRILQLQTATAPHSNGEITPLQVVAEFLQLTPAQTTELGQFLQTRQAALVPLVQNLQP